MGGKYLCKLSLELNTDLWKQNNERHTSWYLFNTSASFNPAYSSSSSGGASKADFDSKLKALEDREATLTQKDKDRSAELDKTLKELQERQEALAKEEKDRAESYEKKLQELQARETEVAKKEEQDKPSNGNAGEADKHDGDSDKTQADKEADIQRKLDDLKSNEQKLAADRASFGKNKADFSAKLEWFKQRTKSFEDKKSSAQHDAVQAKKDLEQRQKEVEGQKPSGGKNASQGQNGTGPDGALQKKQRENADLEKRLAKLEDQLAHMSGSQSKPGNSQVNGTTNGSTTGSSGTLGCGYKHYRPPRKINRKVIGLVYE